MYRTGMPPGLEFFFFFGSLNALLLYGLEKSKRKNG